MDTKDRVGMERHCKDLVKMRRHIMDFVGEFWVRMRHIKDF